MADQTAPAAPQAPAAPKAPQAAAPVVPGTAPADQTEGKKHRGRQKQDKTAYRTDGAPKLTVWPADFDSRVHSPLKAEDFEKEDIYWDKKAEQYEQRAKDCRTEADLFRKYGSSDKRKNISKLTKMSEGLIALINEMKADNIDVAGLNLDLESILKAATPAS